MKLNMYDLYVYVWYLQFVSYIYADPNPNTIEVINEPSTYLACSILVMFFAVHCLDFLLYCTHFRLVMKMICIKCMYVHV